MSAFLPSYMLHSPPSHIFRGTRGSAPFRRSPPNTRNDRRRRERDFQRLFSIPPLHFRTNTTLFSFSSFRSLTHLCPPPNPVPPSDPRRQRLVLAPRRPRGKRGKKTFRPSASAVLSDASPDSLDPLSSGGVDVKVKNTQVTPQAGKVMGTFRGGAGGCANVGKAKSIMLLNGHQKVCQPVKR